MLCGSMVDVGRTNVKKKIKKGGKRGGGRREMIVWGRGKYGSNQENRKERERRYVRG